MCGIYITNINYSSESVVDKLKEINFRGPDNLTVEKVEDITMGHLRLAILDLDKRSNQPYTYKNFHIVFNGEIYNYKSIQTELEILGYQFETSSDTEVLIKGYAEWGINVLEKLNGMFAFAIYDSQTQKIFCARDRLGVKPFYYYWKDGFFEICSQMRPLINSSSEVSEDAISVYLDCGYIPSPFSIIKNINKLQPGHYLIINIITKTLTDHIYWDLKPVKIRDISYDDAKNELHDLIVDAVKIRLQSDVPIGSFLSGGIDSALVSSIASTLSKNPINTFTIGFKDPKYDESKVAKQFADIIDSNHLETICGPKDALKMLDKLVKVYDEPFADSSALPSLLLNSVTKKYATVALSGDGGDESFFGYEHFDYLSDFDKILKVPQFIRKSIVKSNVISLLKRKSDSINEVLSLKNHDEFSWGTFTGFDSLQKNKSQFLKNYYSEFKDWSDNSYQRMADLNIKLWLENDSNVKTDRASMASSVEVRSPFLDYRIIEFARELPVNYRYKDGNKKHILKDILKKYISEDIFTQPKKGFAIPLAKWLREDLKQDVMLNLNEDFLRKIPNLDIEKFKKKMENHFEGKTDETFHIWKLFILSLWYKEFNF